MKQLLVFFVFSIVASTMICAMDSGNPKENKEYFNLEILLKVNKVELDESEIEDTLELDREKDIRAVATLLVGSIGRRMARASLELGGVEWMQNTNTGYQLIG